MQSLTVTVSPFLGVFISNDDSDSDADDDDGGDCI